jgi:hypothetical protein
MFPFFSRMIRRWRNRPPKYPESGCRDRKRSISRDRRVDLVEGEIASTHFGRILDARINRGILVQSSLANGAKLYRNVLP